MPYRSPAGAPGGWDLRGLWEAEGFRTTGRWIFEDKGWLTLGDMDLDVCCKRKSLQRTMEKTCAAGTQGVRVWETRSWHILRARRLPGIVIWKLVSPGLADL